MNLFYGFLSGPENLQSDFVTQSGEEVEVVSRLQKARHLIVGTEYDFTDKLSLNIEGYIKHFNQLTNMNRNKIFDESDFDKPDVLKKDFIVETGFARGVDFLLKYNDENLYVWFVYSLGKVDRWDGITEYRPVFDRRHNINLVGTYKFGEDKSWEINARWNFGTGFPFTQTAGFYQSVDFSEGIATDYTISNSNEVAIEYANLNEGELPTYHRFDLTGAKTFKKYKIIKEEDSDREKKKLQSEIMVTAGMTNLYNRDNVFYVNRVTSEVVRQLPIMPSVGFSFTF